MYEKQVYFYRKQTEIPKNKERSINCLCNVFNYYISDNIFIVNVYKRNWFDLSYSFINSIDYMDIQYRYRCLYTQTSRHECTPYV